MYSVFPAGRSFSPLLPTLRRGNGAVHPLYPLCQYSLADAHLGPGLAADMVSRYFAPRPRFPAFHGRLECPCHADRVIIQVPAGTRARAAPKRRRNGATRKRPVRLKRCAWRNMVYINLCHCSSQDGKCRMKRKRLFIVSFCAALFVVGILITTLRPKRQALYRGLLENRM